MTNISRPGTFYRKQTTYRGTRTSQSVGYRTNGGAKWGVLLVAQLVLSGCAAPLSALNPASRQAQHIAHVWQIMAWGSLLILLVMLALTAIAVKRRSRGELARRPTLFLLGGGVIFPLSVMITLLVYTYAAAPPMDEPQYHVRVTARQWQWDISYPQAPGGARHSVNVLHVPAGVPVSIELRASDVIHGFWVPRLGGKMDAIPGRINTAQISADAPGIYQGVCAEYCGAGHAGMQFKVIAHEPAALDEVLASLPKETEVAP